MELRTTSSLSKDEAPRHAKYFHKRNALVTESANK